MTEKINNCQLEIDRNRGVVYVHSPEGRTIVRIGRIPPMVIDRRFIDVVFDRELAKGYPSVEDIPDVEDITEAAEEKVKKYIDSHIE